MQGILIYTARLLLAYAVGDNLKKARKQATIQPASQPTTTNETESKEEIWTSTKKAF